MPSDAGGAGGARPRASGGSTPGARLRPARAAAAAARAASPAPRRQAAAASPAPRRQTALRLERRRRAPPPRRRGAGQLRKRRERRRQRRRPRQRGGGRRWRDGSRRVVDLVVEVERLEQLAARRGGQCSGRRGARARESPSAPPPLLAGGGSLGRRRAGAPGAGGGGGRSGGGCRPFCLRRREREGKLLAGAADGGGGALGLGGRDRAEGVRELRQREAQEAARDRRLDDEGVAVAAHLVGVARADEVPRPLDCGELVPFLERRVRTATAAVGVGGGDGLSAVLSMNSSQQRWPRSKRSSRRGSSSGCARPRRSETQPLVRPLSSGDARTSARRGIASITSRVIAGEKGRRTRDATRPCVARHCVLIKCWRRRSFAFETPFVAAIWCAVAACWRRPA